MHPRIGEAETEEGGPIRPSFELQVFNRSTVYLLNLRSLDLASSGRLMDSSLTYRISIQYSYYSSDSLSRLIGGWPAGELENTAGAQRDAVQHGRQRYLRVKKKKKKIAKNSIFLSPRTLPHV